MKILCKLPTRSRPDAFFVTLNSLISRQSGDHDIQYIVSIDDDDITMHTSKVLGKLDAMTDVDVVSAPRAGKIGSVNRDMAHALDGWDVVMQIADDFICIVDDWDVRIAEEMEAFKDGDGVVWFFDGYNRETDTLCIMGRKYYERFNYIYYPEYKTFWADTEFTAVADLLDKLVFCEEVLFRHDHPDWTHSHGYDGQKSGYDQLYHENDKQEDRDFDERLFHQRKARDFDLIITKIYTEPNAYDIIQNDIENNFHIMIGKKSEDIKNICIVGAWHGNEIVPLWNNYPNANIYAFEAHPKYYNVLSSNYDNVSRVKLYNKVVTSYSGYIDFYETDMTGNGSILRCQVNEFGHPNRVIEKINLPCTTLNTELSNVHFDLLWVDVQGAELEVLKGVNLNNCDSMFLEIHTHDFVEPWDEEPYKGQCYKEDLEEYLSDSHILHSIGLDNESGNGQGNSFWVKKP